MNAGGRENAVDFVNGVATAITPMAFYETVMVRAYETLVAEDTVVSVDQGAYAAKQLHELTRADAGVEQFARQQAEMNRILAAWRELPARYQQLLLDKLEGKETAISIEPEVGEEGEEEFDPADDEGFEEED